MSTKEPSKENETVQRQKYTGNGPVLLSNKTIERGEGPAHLPLGGEIGLENGLSECGRTNGLEPTRVDDPSEVRADLTECELCFGGSL